MPHQIIAGELSLSIGVTEVASASSGNDIFGQDDWRMDLQVRPYWFEFEYWNFDIV
jgi:hypothetical protein